MTKTKTFENTTAVAGIEKQQKSVTDYAFECETSLCYSKGDPTVRIATSLPIDITRLLKNPAFTVESDTPASNGNPRIVIGTLPDFSYLTYRAGKKTANKTVAKRLANVERCTQIKNDGTKCNSIAIKGTGKCRWHK